MTISLTPTARRVTSLAGLCDGDVHLPGDPGYDAARMPWNVAVDQRPAAVARPRTVSDVQDVVRAAVAAGLRVAPQSTGHNAGPLVAQGLDDVVVVRTERMRGVTIDADAPDRAGRGRSPLDATRPSRPATTASRPCTAARPTSASPATASAAASGGTPASSVSPSNSLTAVELVTRRRRARARRREREPRALLGAARRRWQLRRRHGARVPPLPDRDGVCRHARLGPRPRRARAAPLGRLGARGARRGDHVVPLPQPAAAAGRSRSRSAAARSSSSTAPCSAATPRPARSSACCAASVPRSTPSTACRPGR